MREIRRLHSNLRCLGAFELLPLIGRRLGVAHSRCREDETTGRTRTNIAIACNVPAEDSCEVTLTPCSCIDWARWNRKLEVRTKTSVIAARISYYAIAPNQGPIRSGSSQAITSTLKPLSLYALSNNLTQLCVCSKKANSLFALPVGHSTASLPTLS